MEAVREFGMLLAFVLVPPILIDALRRTLVLEAPVAAVIGVLICATLVLSDISGLTGFYNTFSQRAELHDLNRSTTWLAVCLGPILCYGLCGQVRWRWIIPSAVLAFAAIFLAQGQSAQLGCIAGALAAAVV